MAEQKHPMTDDCDGHAFSWHRCEECEQNLCPCEAAYGHDCEA
jgi:hypothetical protein